MAPQVKTQQFVGTDKPGANATHVGLAAKLYILAAFHIVCCTALHVLFLQHWKPLAIEANVIHAT